MTLSKGGFNFLHIFKFTSRVDVKSILKYLQRVPALGGFWDLKKTVLRKICISGSVGLPTYAKIPHLHVHKPKTVVVGSAVVKSA